MRDLIIDSLAGKADPVPVSVLRKSELFKEKQDEFERHLQALVREGTVVRVKGPATVGQRVVLAECIPGALHQIMNVLEEARSGREGSYPLAVDSIVEAIIGFSEDATRAALQGLIQEGKVIVRGSPGEEEMAFLPGHVMSVSSSKDNTVKRLVKALKNLRDIAKYPAPLEQLLKTADVTGLSASQVRRAAKKSNPRIFLKTDSQEETLAAFADDIDLLTDLSGPLTKLKESRDPKKYPVSLTGLIGVVRAPEGGKRVLKDRVIAAANRPIPGVSAKEIRQGKRTVRKYALRKDEELLELLSLNKDAMQQRILGLWIELEQLRAFKKEIEAAPAGGQSSRPPELKLFENETQRTEGTQHLGKSALSREELEKVWQAIKVASARSKFSWVRISDLRNQFDALPRPKMDEILSALSRDRRINLIPLNDKSILSQGESDQLIKLGDTLYYAVSVRQEG